MLIRFVIELAPNSDRIPLTARTLAETLFRLQHLWAYLSFLGHRDEFIGGPGREPPGFELYYLTQYLLSPRQHGIYQELRGDPWNPPAPPNPAVLTINRIRYESPFQIESEQPSQNLSPSKLKKIFEIVRRVITLEAVQEKAHWEAQIAKQRAIEAALKNSERALDLSKKIKDPQLRDEFMRRLSHAILDLEGRDTPRLKTIDVIESAPEKHKASV